MTAALRYERVEHGPFGRTSFTVSRGAVPYEVPPDVEQVRRGPFWSTVYEAGLPESDDPAEWVIAQAGITDEKTARRVRQVFTTIGNDIGKSTWKSASWAITEALAGKITPDELAVCRDRQSAWLWGRRALHPALLALANEPPERFCLLPNPAHLTALRAWAAAIEAYAQIMTEAINVAMELAAQDRRWLNRWNAGTPIGLWHWSWRSSADVTPLNGGRFFIQCIWAVYVESGVVPNVRVSIAYPAETPAGVVLSHRLCNYQYHVRPWAPDAEQEICLLQGLDARVPTTPWNGPALRFTESEVSDGGSPTKPLQI